MNRKILVIHNILSNLDRYFYIFVIKTIVALTIGYFVIDGNHINIYKNALPLIFVGLIYAVNTFRFYQKPTWKKFIIYILELFMVLFSLEIMSFIGENLLNYYIASFCFLIVLLITHYYLFKYARRVEIYAKFGCFFFLTLCSISFLENDSILLKPSLVENAKVLITTDEYKKKIDDFIEEF